MHDIIIKEAAPTDAGKLVAYSQMIGGETENLTYGIEGMGISVEQEESFLNNIQNDEHSVFFCASSGGRTLPISRSLSRSLRWRKSPSM